MKPANHADGVFHPTSRRRFLRRAAIATATVAGAAARGFRRPAEAAVDAIVARDTATGAVAGSIAGRPVLVAAQATGAVALHGATHVRRGSDPVPGASISILDYGGAGDGGIAMGSVSSGSPVVTLSGPATTVRAGHVVVVAAAGPSGGPLESTVAAVSPDSGLTANQFRMSANASSSVSDTGVMWGTNNHDALRDALAALTSSGGGEVRVPPGRYLLRGAIDAWPPGVDPLPGDVAITGESGASQLLVCGGSSTHCIFYRVNSVTISDLVVRGTPSPQSAATHVDCDVVFRFLNRRGALSDVWLYGVAGESAVVSAYGCDLVIDGGGFLGCVANQKDVVHCDEWAGVTVRDTEFLDFGAMEGLFHAKASQVVSRTSRSWIGIFNPQADLSAPVGGVNGSRCVKIENARFDEGTLNHVLIQPGAPGSTVAGAERRVTAADISGVPGLVLSDASSAGLNIHKVEHLTVRHCHFTAFNSDGGQRTAVQLVDVRDTKLERVVATTNAGKIIADNKCVSLVLDESVYTNLVVDPVTRVRAVRDGQDQGSKTAPGAPSITSATATAGGVSVAWTAPTSDGGDPITAYEVKTYDAGTNNQVKVDRTGNVLSFVITGLTPGTPVYVRVAAVNSTGTGPQSAPSATVTPSSSSTTSTTASSTTSTTASATTTTTAGGAAAPGNLTVTSRTTSTVAIRWDAVAGATEYRAYVSRTSGSGYFLWASGFAGTSATLFGLSGTWYIVVRAVVGGAESRNSNEVVAAAQ